MIGERTGDPQRRLPWFGGQPETDSPIPFLLPLHEDLLTVYLKWDVDEF